MIPNIQPKYNIKCPPPCRHFSAIQWRPFDTATKNRLIVRSDAASLCIPFPAFRRKLPPSSSVVHKCLDNWIRKLYLLNHWYSVPWHVTSHKNGIINCSAVPDPKYESTTFIRNARTAYPVTRRHIPEKKSPPIALCYKPTADTDG